jgi:hypothetical protein
MQRCAYPEFSDPPDQVIGDGLVERKLQCTFACSINGNLIDEMLDAGWVGEKTDVLLEGGEMHQVSLQRKGGDAVADFLLRPWGGLPDGRPDLLQDLLDVGRKSGDVFVDVFGGGAETARRRSKIVLDFTC